jgi:hypothetical protein
MSEKFSPAWGSTTSVSNATSATAAVALPKNCNAVMLTNTSATARTHVALTQYFSEGDTVPTGTAPTTSDGVPVLPNQQVIVYVGPGNAVLRTIATAADGNIIITPGTWL